jgi:hypothetical protein
MQKSPSYGWHLNCSGGGGAGGGGATLAAQTCVAELINLFQPAALKKQFGSRKLKLSIEVLLLIQLFPAWHDEKVDDTIITMNKAAAVEDTVAIYRIPLMSSVYSFS